MSTDERDRVLRPLTHPIMLQGINSVIFFTPQVQCDWADMAMP